MAHHCRRKEIEAEKELRGGSGENRWEPLRCRVMRCDKEREAVRSIRREALKGAKGGLAATSKMRKVAVAVPNRVLKVQGGE